MKASPKLARFDYDHFANVLSNERDRQGLTREEVAARVSIDPHIYAAIERCSVHPNLDEFVRLCAWANRNLSDFLYFDLSEDAS